MDHLPVGGVLADFDALVAPAGDETPLKAHVFHNLDGVQFLALYVAACELGFPQEEESGTDCGATVAEKVVLETFATGVPLDVQGLVVEVLETLLEGSLFSDQAAQISIIYLFSVPRSTVIIVLSIMFELFIMVKEISWFVFVFFWYWLMSFFNILGSIYWLESILFLG